MTTTVAAVLVSEVMISYDVSSNFRIPLYTKLYGCPLGSITVGHGCVLYLHFTSIC
jgi:hypothetical protein